MQGGHLNKVYPQWNALEILKPFEDSRPVGGFCQQYNLVFLQACESFGIPGRAISVGRGQPGNVTGGHEVVELWSNQFGKWIYVDAWSPWYISDAGTGIPLSLLEMLQRRDASLKGQPYPAVKEVVLAVDRSASPLGAMSVTIVVPFAVPSLRHSSLPLTPSLAANNSWLSTAVSTPGVEPSAPSKISLTKTVPAAVPSVFQSSRPLLPSSAVSRNRTTQVESRTFDTQHPRGRGDRRHIQLCQALIHIDPP